MTSLSKGKTSNAEKVCPDKTSLLVEAGISTMVSGRGTGKDEPDANKPCHYCTTTTIDVDADGLYTCMSSSMPPHC